jgi:hypothetical protein
LRISRIDADRRGEGAATAEDQRRESRGKPKVHAVHLSVVSGIIVTPRRRW